MSHRFHRLHGFKATQKELVATLKIKAKIGLALRGENRIRFYLKSFESFSLALRREQDSNLRTSFAGYTLSRRASSTTRAPLLICKRMQRYENK